MTPSRIVVFLPCHTLDDFPYWLDENEADAVLSTWTAAWHPRLLLAAESVPRWASVDLPPPADGTHVGLVPAPFDDRFAAQADAHAPGGSRWIRGLHGRETLVSAALEACGVEDAAVPEGRAVGDFQALGLGVLLSELLARRMRSTLELESTGFEAAAISAARAAVAGDAGEMRRALGECFGCLEAARAQYYPVDVWLLDIVLLAESTLGRGLAGELEGPTPFGLVATGELVERLAARHPDTLMQLRDACAAGRVSPCGGRDEGRPVSECTPEALRGSFARGAAAWRTHVGVVPTTFAQYAGGSSALLPQMLQGLGYSGALWSLFDGSRLPDPSASRIRWAGTGGGLIDAVGRPPLDARSAQTILALAEKLGDAMDHDHTVVLQFARHAGTASPWHELFRRMAALSSVCGSFVTPDELFRKTAGAGTDVSFEPDAFAGPAPPTAAQALDEAVAAATAEAETLTAATGPLAELLTRADVNAEQTSRGPTAEPAASLWTRAGRWFGGGRADDTARFVLDNGLVRLEVHRQTGGILSLRRPGDRGNRISQQIALRTTRPAPAPGSGWESPEDRATYSRMAADTIERREGEPAGPVIESRGRLLGSDDREVGRFVQRVSAVDGVPLVILDLEVQATQPTVGAWFEHYAACRFAWNENEDVELCRSLHTQAVVTERTRFTAPHYLLVKSVDAARAGIWPDAGEVAILTGGLPWHVRPTPHMLDTILVAGGGRQASRRLALGVGLERPWDAALGLLAGDLGLTRRRGGHPHVRITGGECVVEEGRIVKAVVGLLESTGRGGEVRLEWQVDVRSAVACDLHGRPRDDSAVTIDGRAIVASLRRFEWLMLAVEFGP
jgi:hypothetical protein